ncbi:MAG TPA: hypothetical protein PLL30_01010 [Candidatus Krumholzibacteria bacterium]|nr:hypothetical protein [Candidatus Krumholzibacteria bacterium]HPD70341.1 hypothetical protein [Candidatus Krumholzibacteria bacterium]HRY39959.1 hypothetical protein [Candidatus Krumholzibacteria bacterium]
MMPPLAQRTGHEDAHAPAGEVVDRELDRRGTREVGRRAAGKTTSGDRIVEVEFGKR